MFKEFIKNNIRDNLGKIAVFAIIATISIAIGTGDLSQAAFAGRGK